MDFINNHNNNELIDKSQYTFCISLISQLIEEIEIETKNLNKNIQKKILQLYFIVKKSNKIISRTLHGARKTNVQHCPI